MITPILLLWLTTRGIADVDWEVVLAVAMGVGTAAVAWIEHRRTSQLDDIASSLLERVATIEAVAAHRDDLIALGERVNGIGTPPDLTAVHERVAALMDRQVSHAERLAVLEARADHQPWKHTRRKDGKFARADEAPPTE